MADAHEGRQLWIAVFGMYTIDALWTAYLEIRNIQAMEKMSTPPPVLNISAEDFNQIASAIRLESYQNLINAIAQFWIESLQLHSNYYSYVWELSGKNNSNMTARAMWFAALDQMISVLLHAIFRRPHSPSVISVILSTAIAAPTFALYTLFRIKVFELFGSNGMFLLLNIAGIVIGALFCIVNAEIQPDYTELVDDELGSSVKALAVSVGYPPDRIFFLETLCCPNASYQNFIFSKWITIHRSITYIMDDPEVVGVVAHELGHWKYCHHFYRYLTFLVVEIALYFLYTVPYGNPRLLRVFRLDPGVHPVVADLLALQFIGLPFMKMLVGCARLMNTCHEMVADDYACQIWDPKRVRDSELKLYWFSRDKPHHYDSWYSAWYTGYPPVVQRVRRVESHFPPNQHD